MSKKANKNVKKKGSGKFLGFLVLVLIIAVVLLIIFKDEFGFGNGGSDDNADSETSTEATADELSKSDDSVVIIVKQDKYMIDEKEYTLSELEALIKEDTDKSKKYVMEDNYAGTEAWDQLKSLFASYDITPVHED